MKSEVLELGDITFSPGTRAIAGRDGQPVQLRNKSKAVLDYLVQRPNQTLPKAEILSAIWSDVIATDESLVQCIADIRRVIGSDARRIVETIPREGYRLNVVMAKNSWRSGAILGGGIFVMLIAGIALQFWDTQRQAPPAAETAIMNEPVASPPGTESQEAYLELLQGRVSANRFSLDESLIAERHFRQAIALDPNYARAHAELGTLLAVRFENNWTMLYAADKEKALYYAQRAVDLEPDLWLGHYALGRLNSVFSDLDVAAANLRTAMSLRPENEDARAYLGVVLNFQGHADQAATILDQAIASHPNPPFWYYFGFGHALYNLGRLSEAETALTTCLELSASSPYCLRYLIAVHGEMGNQVKAAAASQAYTDMGFDASISEILGLMTFHHQDDRAQLEAGLRQAGLPF